MHRLVVFNQTSALSTDTWRLGASEVADFSASADLLDRCHQRLDEVEELCRSQFDQARAQGFAEGFDDGCAAGRREAASQLGSFLAELSAERALNRAAVGRLAMDVVRRLLGDLDTDRSIALFIARQLDELRDERPLALRVPAGRAAGVERLLQDRDAGVRLIEEPGLRADECVFELASGRAHAALSLQLEALDAMIGSVEADLIGRSPDAA